MTARRSRLGMAALDPARPPVASSPRPATERRVPAERGPAGGRLDGGTTEPESTPPAPPPLHARPDKVRVIAYVRAPLVVLIFGVISTSLDGTTGDGPGYVPKGD